MSQIIQALKEIKQLPYYKNEAAGSGLGHKYARHEEAISSVLEANNFTRKILPLNPHTGRRFSYPLVKKKHWMDHPEECTILDIGQFIEQPFGSQQSPDFIIKVSNDFILFLEAKSSKELYPTYNSCIPHQNYVYVFTSKKTNQTTLYKGERIVTLEQEKLLKEYIEESRKRDEEFNKRLMDVTVDTNHRGIQFYTRPMIIQKGGKEYVDYFTHSQREQAENGVFEWVKKQSLSE